MHRKLITAVLMGAALSFRMVDDAPAATPAPVDGQTANADAPTVTVAVPTEHETLVQRVLALLEKDATWLKDNIEAGLTHFEALFKDDDE